VTLHKGPPTLYSRRDVAYNRRICRNCAVYRATRAWW